MRPYCLLGTTCVIGLSFSAAGCNSTAGETAFQPSPGAAGSTGNVSLKDGSAADGAPRSPPPLLSPTQLVTGQTSISGVTSNGWVVFRDAEMLKAVRLPPDSGTQDITTGAGNVLVRGCALFDWKDVDWKTNRGDLSVWTSEAGTHEIGTTAYSEALVSASERGRTIVYTTNATAETMDLVIADAGFSTPEVLISGMGRGSETTCGPSFGFVGERLFVGWCPVGSRTGKIERYEQTDIGWMRTQIADDALPAWSASASGDRVFYQSGEYGARYAENGETHAIDSAVSGGFILPDGSAALYAVGDQLRRTSLPDVNPFTVVTRGYAQVAEFTKGFDRVLYSSTVTYDQGTRRNLRITRTDAFNPDPIELIPDPVATLARSALTKDGQFVLYLTDVTPSGATLHVRSVDGTERMVIPNVLDAVAAHDATIVFTDGSSDPNQYPIVADLKALNLVSNAPAELVEPKIAEPRNFQLDATGTLVIYVRSGIDRDAGPAREGLFVRTIP